MLAVDEGVGPEGSVLGFAPGRHQFACMFCCLQDGDLSQDTLHVSELRFLISEMETLMAPTSDT